MKKNFAIWVVVIAVATICSCKEEKKLKPDNIIVKPAVVEEVDTVIHQMGEIESTVDTVNWVGSTYKVKVKRYTNDSLTYVVDDNGKKYRNNLISLVITRKDGSTFFDKVFRKANFSEFLDEKFLDGNVLLGMVYNGTDADNIFFLGSVGKPDVLTEEYVPFNVAINRHGEVHIEKANLNELEGVMLDEDNEGV